MASAAAVTTAGTAAATSDTTAAKDGIIAVEVPMYTVVVLVRYKVDVLLILFQRHQYQNFTMLYTILT